MIVQAVQNFTTNNLKAKSANYDAKSNVMSKMGNSNQVADSFTKSNQVAFKGNLAKAGQNLLGDTGSKIGSRFRRVGEEATEVIGRSFRKLKGKNELPMTEKPVLAALTYPERTANFLKAASNSNVDFASVSIDKAGGISNKTQLRNNIANALENGDINQAEADALNTKLSFCGNKSDGTDIAGTIDISDIHESGIDPSDIDFSGGGDDGGLLDLLGDLLGAS